MSQFISSVRYGFMLFYFCSNAFELTETIVIGPPRYLYFMRDILHKLVGLERLRCALIYKIELVRKIIRYNFWERSLDVRNCNLSKISELNSMEPLNSTIYSWTTWKKWIRTWVMMPNVIQFVYLHWYLFWICVNVNNFSFHWETSLHVIYFPAKSTLRELT